LRRVFPAREGGGTVEPPPPLELLFYHSLRVIMSREALLGGKIKRHGTQKTFKMGLIFAF